MLMLKNKFAKLTMGLIVTSIISVGAISPVSAMERQPNLDNNAGSKTQCDVIKEYTNEHAAAQFTLNEDGEKVLTVTPKSDFKWNIGDSKDGKCEAPVVAVKTPVVETPVIDEETPVVETPVVDEETPVVDEETPVVDENLDDESIQNGVYSHLLNAYDKLLTLYDKLLNSFELGATN